MCSETKVAHAFVLVTDTYRYMYKQLTRRQLQQKQMAKSILWTSKKYCREIV